MIKKIMGLVALLLAPFVLFSDGTDFASDNNTDYGDQPKVYPTLDTPAISDAQEIINTDIANIKSAIQSQQSVDKKYDIFINRLLACSSTTVKALQANENEVRNISVAITGADESSEFNFEHIKGLITTTSALKEYEDILTKNANTKRIKELTRSSYTATEIIKNCWKSISNIKNSARFLRKLFNRLTPDDCIVFMQQATTSDNFLKAIEYSITKTKPFSQDEIKRFNQTKEVALRKQITTMNEYELKLFKTNGKNLFDDLSMQTIDKRLTELKKTPAKPQSINPADIARTPKGQPTNTIPEERARIIKI